MLLFFKSKLKSPLFSDLKIITINYLVYILPDLHKRL